VTYSAEQGCHVENVTYGLETFFVCLPFSAIFKKRISQLCSSLGKGRKKIPVWIKSSLVPILKIMQMCIAFGKMRCKSGLANSA